MLTDWRCLQEPLQSSVKKMSDSSSDNDDGDDWKDWQLVVLTAGICAVAFIVVQIGIYFHARRSNDDSKAPLTSVLL